MPHPSPDPDRLKPTSAGAAFKMIVSLGIHEASPRFSAIKGSSGEIVGFKDIEELAFLNQAITENVSFC